MDKAVVSQRQSYIQLGRTGDLLLLFPAFKAIHDRTGQKPVVVVSNWFASVLEGVSYAEPFAINCDPYEDLPLARQMADQFYGNHTVLQCSGKGWTAPGGDYRNYMHAMWGRAGFTFEEMRSLPLVIDRRSHERERELVKTWRKTQKPLLLINFGGMTSPFQNHADIRKFLETYNRAFEILDLATIRAHRIFDLLGLYDVASGLITGDTATAHLAPASKVPTIWLTQDGGGASTPRGNCVLELKYRQAPNQVGLMTEIVEQWLYEPVKRAA